MGLGYNDPWVESHVWPQQMWRQKSSRGQWPLSQVFEKKGHCIHILWCIFMGLGHNGTLVESHMWPQQTLGQRSTRGQWPLVRFFFFLKSLYPHTLTYFQGNWKQWSLGWVTHYDLNRSGFKGHLEVIDLLVKFLKNSHCIHILWCITMGVKHTEPQIESHNTHETSTYVGSKVM